VEKSIFTELAVLGTIRASFDSERTGKRPGDSKGRRAMDCTSPVKDDHPLQGVLNVRAAHRYAVCVASLMLIVSGFSSAFAQGTAGTPPRRPTTTGGTPGTGAGTSGVRPASGATTGSPQGTAPRTTPASSPTAAAAGGGGTGAARTGGTPSVVVIDIGEVFKGHVGFNQQVEAIKKEMKDLEAWVQTEQKKVVDARAKLAEYNTTSPEYKKFEESVAHMQSDLQVAATLKQKAILEQEAKVYYSTYEEIYKQVEEFSDRYGISLVLRHSNVAIDPAKRDSVFRGLERNIIYQRNLDITQEVLSRVNRTSTARAPTGGAGGTRVPAGTVRQ